MGPPKNSTKYQRINLSNTPTHKYKRHQVANDRAPEEAKKAENYEKR
jgi:hypothetical protein